MFITIILGLIAMTVWWRVRLEPRLAELVHGRLWRVLATGFVVMVIACPLIAAELGHVFYAPISAAGFLWHVLVLPEVIAVMVAVDLAMWVMGRSGAEAPVDPRRRKFLTAVAAIAPPLATVGLAGIAEAQLGHFRVRELELSQPGWPMNLDGFAIAFVADVHAGPFSNQAMLERIVQRTNTIHHGGPADLVLMGGDLINTSLRDLPAALEMATALRSRLGTIACMGNHDVMQNPGRFIEEVEKRGIPLLRDDAMTLTSNGTRFQVMGVDWRLGDDALYESVAAAAARRNPLLFPICLAHHPHCWDEGVRQGLPLMLSGHTHGGQIMLTDSIGAGPLRFRYWSGEHRRDGSTLVISNGVGNWFPLRVNAPAEIMKITLRAVEPV